MQPTEEKLKAAIQYMYQEYGITPENVSEELKKLKEKFYERRRQVEKELEKSKTSETIS